MSEPISVAQIVEFNNEQESLLIKFINTNITLYINMCLEGVKRGELITPLNRLNSAIESYIDALRLLTKLHRDVVDIYKNFLPEEKKDD